MLKCNDVSYLVFSEILKDADLTTLSSKKIRKQLEEKYGIDLTDRSANDKLDGCPIVSMHFIPCLPSIKNQIQRDPHPQPTSVGAKIFCLSTCKP